MVKNNYQIYTALPVMITINNHSITDCLGLTPIFNIKRPKIINMRM